MYDQIQRMTREMDTIVETLHSVHGQQRNLQESLRDHQRTVYSKLEGFCQSQAFTGELADAFFEHHRRIAAQARLALQNLGDHADVVHHHMQLLQHTREHFSTQMTQVMYRIPPEVWWFLGDRVRLPTMDEMLLGDAGDHLLSVWDRFVPAQMPHHDQNPLTGLIEWAGDEIHGAIASLFNTITSWGMHLEEVRDIVGWAGTLVQDLQGSLYQHHQSFTMAALSCPCAQSSPHNPYQDPLPPPDTTQHIDMRARRLHDLLYDPHISEDDRGTYALQLLQSLDFDELRAMMDSYARQYQKADFEQDLFTRIHSPIWRYQLTQLLFPEQIQTQQLYPMAPGSGNEYSHIEMNPPIATIPINLAATIANQHSQTNPVTFTFIPGSDRGTPTSIVSFVISSTGHISGVQNGASTNRSFDGTGDYTIVYEVTYADGPPVYYSYVQHVATARDLALTTVQQMPPAPSEQFLLLLYNAMVQQTTDSKQKENLQKIIDKIKSAFQDGEGTPIPLQVSYVPEVTGSGTPTSIPLQLYVKKIPNAIYPGAYIWEIVDLTSSQGGPYRGGSFQDAWNAFVQNNPYPTGQIALTNPPLPNTTPGVQCFEHMGGNALTNPNDWASLIPFLQRLSLVGFFAGIAAMVLAPELALPIMIISGLALAGSGGLDLYLRMYNGTLAWDQETGWDIFNIAAGLVGVGELGLSAEVVDGTSLATSAATASKLVRITRIGGLLINGYQGVLVTWDTWTQIQQILRSHESDAEKVRDIAKILGMAGFQGGLILIGVKKQWEGVISDQLLNTLRNAGVGDSIIFQIRKNQDQQTLDAITAFLKDGSSDGSYNPERIKALNQAVESYSQQIGSGLLPQDGSVTNYLMIATQVAPDSNIWLNGLQIQQVHVAVEIAASKGLLSPELAQLIQTDPQMWGIIANKNFEITHEVAQDLQAKYELWKSGRSQITFAEYLRKNTTGSGITYAMSYGEGSVPLNVTIAGYDAMTTEQRQLAFLNYFTHDQGGSSLVEITTNADGTMTYALNSALSANARNVLQKILGKLDTSAFGSDLTSTVRKNFSEQFNKQLAAELVSMLKTDPAKTIAIWQEVSPYLEGASKGNVGKLLLYDILQSTTPNLRVEGDFPRFVMDQQDLATFKRIFLSDTDMGAQERSGLETIQKQIFDDTSTGQDRTIRPDLLSVDGKVAVDVKAGYLTGNIERAQIVAYLLKAERGQIQHVDYLFAPGVTAGDAETSAINSFKTIAKIIPEEYMGYFSVYYMDERGNFFKVVPGSSPFDPPSVQEIPQDQLGQLFTVPTNH